MSTPAAFHEAAHAVVALLHGLTLRHVSIERGRERVELRDPRPRPGNLRTFALVCAAGPAADLQFDARGWRGYTTDARSDLAKLRALAEAARTLGRPFSTRDVLDEAAALVWSRRDVVAECARCLAADPVMEGGVLDAMARYWRPRLGVEARA